MQEIYRALFVVLFIAVFVYGLAKKPLTEEAIAPADFDRRRNLWLAITAVLFLAGNFWVFMAVSGGLLLWAAKRDTNTIALLFATVLAVPLITAEVGAFGIVNYLLALDFLRLFSLLVLLPAYWLLRKQPSTPGFGQTGADRFLAAYLLFRFAMELATGNITNALREGFNLVMDIFLPYYVASRSLRSVPAFREALSTYVVVAAVLGGIGVFEFGKKWLLYSTIPEALAAPWGLGQYIGRGDSLRALANTGQPIVLGFVLALAFCFYQFVRESISSPLMRNLGLLGLLGGLVSPLSRGPWVGAVVGYLVFLAFSPKGLGNLAKRGLLAVGLFMLLLASPVGDSIIALMPFVGNVDSQNVSYRQDLVTNALIVIGRNPLLGALDFIKAPEMEALRWGSDGIIDIVNSYIAVTLSYGLVGLVLFLGFMLITLLGVYKSMRAAAALDGSMEMLGRTLFATLACISITIYTVSSISYISVLFWLLFGIGAAYQAMVQRAVSSFGVRAPAPTVADKLLTPRAPRPRAAPAARRAPPPPPEPTRQAPLHEATRQMPLYDEATRHAPLYDEATQHAPLDDEATQHAPLDDEATRKMPLR